MSNKRDRVFSLAALGYNVREIGAELKTSQAYVRRVLTEGTHATRQTAAKPHSLKSVYQIKYLQWRLEAAQRRVDGRK